MFDVIEAKPTENKLYTESAEWQAQLEKGRNAICQNYTVVYREDSGELKEAFHWISEDEIGLIKEKYKTKKCEVVRVLLKGLPFGEYLKSISGKRSEAK